MHNSPLLSIVIPVYNVEAYIERCTRSLFEQTLSNVEFIFVNDCTQDRSVHIIEDILKEYPSRKEQVKIVHHLKNQGLTSARNTGLNLAQGEYVSHCDSDDWVDPTMYEEMLELAENNQADIVYCDIMMHFAENNTEIYNSAAFSIDKVQLMRNYISSVWTSVVNMVVKKDLYDDHFLQSPRHISYCEDYWLSVRLFHFAKRIYKLQKPFYHYDRTNQTSILHKLNSKSEQEERIANLDTITFFQKEGVLSLYERELSWRILKSTHDSIYHPGRYVEFLEIYPTAHQYIWSCPFVNKKSKIFMWMISHKMKYVALFLLKVRYIIKY